MASDEDRVALLKRVRLLASVPDDVLAELAEDLHEQTLVEGARVFGLGDPSAWLYFLVEGRVEVATGDGYTKELAAGSAFGEVGLVSGRPRRATVTTLAPTRFLTLAKADFDTAFDRSPALARGVVQALAEYLEDKET